jgi:hypothetical protein
MEILKPALQHLHNAQTYKRGITKENNSNNNNNNNNNSDNFNYNSNRLTLIIKAWALYEECETAWCRKYVKVME